MHLQGLLLRHILESRKCKAYFWISYYVLEGLIAQILILHYQLNPGDQVIVGECK